MPIYEYVCHHCGERFEKLVLRPSQNPVTCPYCGSEDVERAVSSFASFGGCTTTTSGYT